MDNLLLNYITQTIPEGSHILELGNSTYEQLSEFYQTHSIVEDENDVLDGRFIYAPVPSIGWYSINVLKRTIDFDYSLLIINGPSRGKDRIIEQIGLFKTDIPIIIMNVQLEEERQIFYRLAERLNKNGFMTEDLDNTMFGVLNEDM